MEIKIDDLNSSDIFNLLSEHLGDMHATSPPESVHALDIEQLKKPEITFWSVWIKGGLAGCGALKELDSYAAEIKSMRTAKNFRRQGVAAALLGHILDEARDRHYQTLYLETGSMEYFAPAIELYKGFGFVECDPFADYVLDPNSVFMKKML
jgi:putative acetyltransferase